MALNIKDPEVGQLARELAATTGETITEAARTAFAERLRRLRTHDDRAAARGRVREVIERARERVSADDRTDPMQLLHDRLTGRRRGNDQRDVSRRCCPVSMPSRT